MLPTFAADIKNTRVSAMGKSEIELHKQVEQQRISLKKLIDKHTRNTKKVRIPKQENANRNHTLTL